jgi:hypothetical protein
MFAKGISHNSYIRILAGSIIQKGKFEIQKNALLIQQETTKIGGRDMPSPKTYNYKYKLSKAGYDYIHADDKGGKTLYECKWAGSLIYTHH